MITVRKVTRVCMYVALFMILGMSITVSPIVAQSDSGTSEDTSQANDSIHDWLNMTTEDSRYDSLRSPNQFFSGDYEVSNRGDFVRIQGESLKSIQGNSDKYVEKLLDPDSIESQHELYDSSFETYPKYVNDWNEINFGEFRRTNTRSTVAPGESLSQANSGRYIKDGVVETYSIDPHVIVHESAGQINPLFPYLDGYIDENISRLYQSDTTQYRVGSTVDVYATVDAWVDVPENRYERTRRVYYDLQSYDIVNTEVHTTSCVSSDVCVVDRSSRDSETHEFTNIQLSQSGEHTITIRSTIDVEIEKEVERRFKECDEEGSCSYYWETTSVTTLDESQTFSDVNEVYVAEPEITVQKAEFESGAEEFYIEGLGKSEWKQLNYVTEDDGIVEAVSSQWRYFSSRDARWDTHCVVYDSGSSVSFNECTRQSGLPVALGTIAGEESQIRPLRAHAYPRESTDHITPQTGTIIREIVSTETTSKPPLRKHETCERAYCSWIFYERMFGESTNSYETADELVLRRPREVTRSDFFTGSTGSSSAEAIQITGLTPTISSRVTFESTKHVQQADVDGTIVEYGAAINDDERRSLEQEYGVDSFESTDILLNVSLTSVRTGEAIQPTKRGETYTIESLDGNVSRSISLTDSGNRYLSLPRNDYRLTYTAQPWYAVDDRMISYESDQTTVYTQNVDSDALLWMIVQLGGLLFAVLTAMVYMGRALGMDIGYITFINLFFNRNK